MTGRTLAVCGLGSLWKKTRLCGLSFLEDPGLNEIGCHFVIAAWGQGVATEVGTRVLDYGFRELASEPIVAVTHSENAGSQNVLRKIGL